ncbi:MAG: DUF4032 domain-containing protein [Nitrolancea sp.]
MTFQLVTLTAQPDFLDFPWDQPLAEWQSDQIVDVARGIHRHVVRFISCDDNLYALKEIPERIAEREYRLLRVLAEREIPVVEAIGIARRGNADDHSASAAADERPAILITRYLDFSLPYRIIFATMSLPELLETLLDALAELLVRVHLIGCFWGDCSLSNTLFRRDAGALTAYLVDAETSEVHPSLSDGMRSFDLDLAVENIFGDLVDLQAAGRLDESVDPLQITQEIRKRYDALWSELTRVDVFGADERYLVERRLRHINELGFDVKEVELVRTGDKFRLKLQTQVVEIGHHRRKLQRLTGLEVQENQARRLLNDIAGYRAYLERLADAPIAESVAAHRWLVEVFEFALNRIPPELNNKLEPAEMFHQILDHRWFLSETASRDVGLADAADSYVRNVLRYVPDERQVLATADPDEPDPEVYS